MQLPELMRDLPQQVQPTIGQLDSSVEVSGVSYDSRSIGPGDLFVAWKGEASDGREYAEAALDAGATAVLAWAPPHDALRSRLERDATPWLEAESPRRLLGPLAARLLGEPHRKLELVGITGTNGKTTTAWIVRQLLRAAGREVGLIGTLGYHYGDREWPGERTTPEGSDLMKALAGMSDAGADAVVMEISSHALSQGRCEGIELAAAAFTNLTRDHLDFHGDMEGYYRAKAALFDLLAEGARAVVHVSDEWSRRLADELRASGRTLVTVGGAADVQARDATCDDRGIRATLETPTGGIEVNCGLLGRFNLENLMTAVAVAGAFEVPTATLEGAIADLEPVPGRMETVSAGQPFPIIVDYAHTEDGLRSVLEALREITDRKVAVVFGCGGDRDRGKRPTMGRIAGELSDLPIATSDNPRSEDPLAILSEVEVGLRESENRKYKIIPDRREAIRRAVQIAGGREGWCVVVAGKGHEEGQVIGDEVRPFSDRSEVTAAVEELLGQTTHG